MVSEGDVVEVSDSPGSPYSVVCKGRVVVIVLVVVDFVVFTDVDARVGGTKSIGASSGLLELVNAMAAHTTSPITTRPTTLAPATAGVE